VEDRLFATVFLGSGLLFLALVFVAAVTSLSLMEMLESTNASQDVWTYGRNNSQGLISVYAMRMAAVFTLSVSTAGLRAAALPRWVCYVGYLVALALLVGSANQRWLQLLFPAWVLLVSAAILLRSPADQATAS
jgi:Na+/phosphate symporter